MSGHHTPKKNAHFTVKVLSAYICSMKLHMRDTASDMIRTITDGNNIHGVYKRMMQFQKLTRNLFLIFHGQNVHR